MLAYVFWHWPAPSIEPAVYEQALAGFHGALRVSPPRGFLGSYAHRVESAPWLPAGTLAPAYVYEDWYRLETSAALDALDEAAVSSPLREPHDRVARIAAGGTAGL